MLQMRTRIEVRNLAFAYFTPREYPTHRMLQELIQLDGSDSAVGDLAIRLLPVQLRSAHEGFRVWLKDRFLASVPLHAAKAAFGVAAFLRAKRLPLEGRFRFRQGRRQGSRL